MDTGTAPASCVPPVVDVVVDVTDGPDVHEFGDTVSVLFDEPYTVGPASNHIGLRTCAAILKLLGGEFITHRDGDDFTAEFTLPVTPPDAAQSET